jgi:hypothetical protein
MIQTQSSLALAVTLELQIRIGRTFGRVYAAACPATVQCCSLKVRKT